MKVDTCSTCAGRGFVYILIEELEGDAPADKMICTECDGTGTPYDD